MALMMYSVLSTHGQEHQSHVSLHMEEDMVTGVLTVTQTETEVDLAETEGVHSNALSSIQTAFAQTFREWPVLKMQAHCFCSWTAASHTLCQLLLATPC